MIRRNPILALVAVSLWAACLTFTTSSVAGPNGVRIIPEDGKLRIEVNGEFFSDYYFKGHSRPILHPIIGPGGRQMTRNHPMSEAPGEAKDHKHHKALWYAHGEINGQDFWSEGANAGQTVHMDFMKIISGEKKGVIKTINNLVANDGTVVCTDVRTITIHNRPATERLLDFEITVHASHGDVVMGDTKEGSMAIRLAPTMRLKGEVAQGHIVNSEGVRDGDTWGKRAAWVDYYGPVQGKTVGVAIFDHPSNPRHPTWWHVRDYGLFAANPFGVHDFERKPKGTGDFKIPSGESATWKYQFYFHEGNEQEANVEQAYAKFAN